MKGINRRGVYHNSTLYRMCGEKVAANGFWSRAFGVEINLCSEASGEFALALKHAIGRDHFRDPHIL